MTTSRPAPARATAPSSRQSIGRRDFLGLAAAAVAGIGGISLLGNGSAHDGHGHDGTPPASPAASPAASPVAANTVAIATMDIRFEPNAITIPANTDVTIEVTNQGVMPHDLIVPGLGVNSGRLGSGQTVSITVNAAPGAYPFHCSVPGHMQAGMRGTLTVE